MIELKPSSQVQRTSDLLNYVSRRLSGREDCKQVEFIVDLGCTDSRRIIFDPDLFVYRDLHHRKDIDQFRIIDLALNKMFPEILKEKSESGEFYYDVLDTYFLLGMYKYELSRNGKKRRWIKL